MKEAASLVLAMIMIVVISLKTGIMLGTDECKQKVHLSEKVPLKSDKN
jgi:hypothetical protein